MPTSSLAWTPNPLPIAAIKPSTTRSQPFLGGKETKPSI
ncbi:hypothetical protein SLEP1_g15300 [Rubroshorea leprosula]|uniref:Uncharacterized protein n=1 Tax=Rubroshorea leprosula TaxID=152421 RepID=A0AAV5IXE3_9ROSI|nr:hypothetical protein SLEP1_g15300 [Rubroshorea leprosula]